MGNDAARQRWGGDAYAQAYDGNHLLDRPSSSPEREVMAERYDVVYHSDMATIAPHFCRDWDVDGGCYGTNPVHGLSLDDACKEVADYYQSVADKWRNKTHHEVLYYTEEP